MSVSDDIDNLFKRFGGDPDRYQEVARDDAVKHATSRWPLLAAVDIAHPGQVPGAGQPASRTASTQAKSPVQVAGVPAANVAIAGAATRDRTTFGMSSTPPTSDTPREPLFARVHRHATMPPPVEPSRPASTRFSAARDERAAASANEVAPPGPPREETSRTSVMSAAHATTMPPGVPAAAAAAAAVPAATPTRDESRQSQVRILTDRKQTFARAPAPGAAPAQSQSQSSPRAASNGSILSGMFAAPAPEPSAQPGSRELSSVFTRLAGTPGSGRP
ncbi:cellulose biosynthesis protein BcsP [Paraburkholderia rhizosphaerae]|uniref:Cellulose biosynthesis protein BcsR n=1 Tax=Paraburkholderia rhizosphaerae TaxID=480658 RepID=A0A4R8LVU7_9BURK|nr:cellulose biosynthesis protein BcsP [Paraburkholderia rhizosphaerae]TDY50806.1 hypothetical protein BX592_10841 [Paraburkholderia rhizosphaerae]